MSTEASDAKQPHANAVKQRVVVVTGANRGIGFEFVRQFLEDEAHPAIEAFPNDTMVVATARNPSEATDLHLLKEKYPDRLDIQRLDVADTAQIQALAKHVSDTYERIDLLLNNAGMMESDVSVKPSTFSKEEAKHILEVNSLAPIELTTAFLPLLRSTLKFNSNVRVAYISSILGSVSEASGCGVPAYRASKAALNMFVRAYSFEVPELAFSVIHPGWVQTELGERGGRQAPIDPPTSVKGCLKIIQHMHPSKRPSAIESFDGTHIAW